MKKSIVYFVSYVLLLVISFSVFYIFKPYSYVDNATSHIICNKNSASFESGWNFVYAFDAKLDEFNDIKARKMCEYNLVKDYDNTVKTPPEVNYRFEPNYIKESSWADTIFMASATLIFGFIFIEFVKLKFTTHTSLVRSHQIGKFILLATIFACGLFYFFLYKPAASIFCKRQIARKVNNFKRVIFKYGIFPIPEEDAHIKSLTPGLYQRCLANEGIKTKN